METQMKFAPIPFDVIEIDLDLVDSSAVQPDGRDGENCVQPLLDAIKKSKVISPPALGKRRGNQGITRYEVIDGHRRLAVARLLGLTKLACIVYDTTSPAQRAALFHFYNGRTKALQGNARIQSWAKGITVEERQAALDAMTSFQRKQITDLIAILGEEKVIAMGRKGLALATAASCTRKVQSWAIWLALDCPTAAQIALWIINHEMSRLIDAVARSQSIKDAKAIISCVLANKKCFLKR